jgi:hypothetical protein
MVSNEADAHALELAADAVRFFPEFVALRMVCVEMKNEEALCT